MSLIPKIQFFIHRFSNAAKVVNKRILRDFSLPNVHYAERKILIESNMIKIVLSICRKDKRLWIRALTQLKLYNPWNSRDKRIALTIPTTRTKAIALLILYSL